MLPFLLFSGYSGHLADARQQAHGADRRQGLRDSRDAPGLAAFFSTRIELMLVVLFLMALHSTLFSPAKYGIVPEMLPDRDLSRANALLEMSTFVAIVLGTSIGVVPVRRLEGRAVEASGCVTLGVAVAGLR